MCPPCLRHAKAKRAANGRTYNKNAPRPLVGAGIARPGIYGAARQNGRHNGRPYNKNAPHPPVGAGIARPGIYGAARQNGRPMAASTIRMHRVPS